MKRLIEFDSADGTTVVVEMDEPEGEGMVRASRPGEIAEKARQTFEEAVARIKPAANAIVTQLRELATAPDEIDVEFGIKLSVKAGAIIASTDAEANFKVAMRWKRKA
jgi:hypothetical protein